MRKILVIGAMVLLVGSAHAQATKGQETAPATPDISEPQAAPSPAVSAPAAPAIEAPATAQGPATQRSLLLLQRRHLDQARGGKRGDTSPTSKRLVESQRNTA